MVKVYRSSIVKAASQRTWALIRDFNGLPKWHPLIGESQIEGGLDAAEVGCVRRFSLRSDGSVLREQLLALSDLERTLTYNILESPMPVSRYVATLRVTPVTVGDLSFVEWWAEFEVTSGPPQDTASHIGDSVFVVGFDAINRILRSQ